MRFSKFFNQASKRVFTKEISGLVLPVESYTEPIELMDVPVEAGKEYELHYVFIGTPAPDATTNPVIRVYGGVSFTGFGFNMAPDDPGLISNGTTEGEPWALEDSTRQIIVEDGVMRLSMWVKDGTDWQVPAPPANPLEIDKGIVILREM